MRRGALSLSTGIQWVQNPGTTKWLSTSSASASASAVLPPSGRKRAARSCCRPRGNSKSLATVSTNGPAFCSWISFVSFVSRAAPPSGRATPDSRLPQPRSCFRPPSGTQNPPSTRTFLLFALGFSLFVSVQNWTRRYKPSIGPFVPQGGRTLED